MFTCFFEPRCLISRGASDEGRGLWLEAVCSEGDGIEWVGVFFFFKGEGRGELVAVVVREACNVCGRERG